MDPNEILATAGRQLTPTMGTVSGSWSVKFDGGAVAASGLPVPDYNVGLIHGAATAHVTASAIAGEVQARDAQIMVLVTSESADGARLAFAGTDLVEAGTAPLMVRHATALPDGEDDGVFPLEQDDGDAWTRAIVEAFALPAEPTGEFARGLLGKVPDRIYGLVDERMRSCVWLTGQESVRGIWAMGTPAADQRKGYGARLLSEVMRREAADGASTFYLVATPQGYPLYVRLGFDTLDELVVWVRGDSPEFPSG